VLAVGSEQLRHMILPGRQTTKTEAKVKTCGVPYVASPGKLRRAHPAAGRRSCRVPSRATTTRAILIVATAGVAWAARPAARLAASRVGTASVASRSLDAAGLVSPHGGPGAKSSRSTASAADHTTTTRTSAQSRHTRRGGSPVEAPPTGSGARSPPSDQRSDATAEAYQPKARDRDRAIGRENSDPLG